MPDLILTRVFDVPPERVFAFLSRPEHLLKWWGPEGMSVPVHDLDFSRPGPWFSEMHGSDGAVYKVSGQVTEVEPPRSISFTWAWHDDQDARGHESHVRYELTSQDGGTLLTLTHSGLPDEDACAAHESGWNSALGKLGRQVAEAAA